MSFIETTGTWPYHLVFGFRPHFVLSFIMISELGFSRRLESEPEAVGQYLPARSSLHSRVCVIIGLGSWHTSCRRLRELPRISPPQVMRLITRRLVSICVAAYVCVCHDRRYGWRLDNLGLRIRAAEERGRSRRRWGEGRPCGRHRGMMVLCIRRGRRMLLDTAGFFRDGYFSNSPNEAVIIFCVEKVFWHRVDQLLHSLRWCFPTTA